MTDHSPDFHQISGTADPFTGLGIPRLRRVDRNQPWKWLEAGWNDVRQAPVISFGFGLLAVVSSWALVLALTTLGMFYLALPMAAGFMLVGPILAIGLYEVSRLHGAGERATMAKILNAYIRTGPRIMGIGLILMLALLAWIRIAFLIFALFFSDDPPGFDQLIDKIFYSAQTIPFLLTGTVVGGMIAAAVFAVSAISIPMLLDRNVSVATALATSVQAVLRNGRTMAAWAGLIVLFTAAGMVTLFLGLALTFPLIGHATWHAYKDIVGA